MHSTKCLQCGKDFESPYAGRKFCSRECYSMHLSSIKPLEQEENSSPKGNSTLEKDLTREISRLTIENARLSGVKQFTEEEQERHNHRSYQQGYNKAESDYKERILGLEKKQKAELEARPVKIETQVKYVDRIVEKVVPKIEYVDRIKTIDKPVSSWLSFKEDFSYFWQERSRLIVLFVILAITVFVIYETFPLITKFLEML